MIVRLMLLIGVLLAVAMPAQAQRCPGTLPPAVEAKRAAIVAAAKARDWPALKRQIGPGEFAFSFGDDADAIAYWRQSVKDGIDIPRYIAAIFSMGCAIAIDSGAYLFPAAATFDWKELTASEQKALETLYGKKIDEWYVEGRAKGYYVGWRGTIEKSGAWSAFVAGD